MATLRTISGITDDINTSVLTVSSAKGISVSSIRFGSGTLYASVAVETSGNKKYLVYRVPLSNVSPTEVCTGNLNLAPGDKLYINCSSAPYFISYLEYSK